MQTVTIQNLNPGETGYKTAGGNYVAVSYERNDPRVGYICVKMTARIVTSAGVSVNDAAGNPLVIPHGFSTRGDNITASHTLAQEQQDWLTIAEPFIDNEVSAQTHMTALLTGA